MPGFNIQTHTPTGINPALEYHRSHRWVIDNLGMPSGMPTIHRLHAQSVQLPSLVLDEEKIKSGATLEYKIAKKANWQDITVKFYDVHGLYKLYQEWQDLIWNQEDGIGRADKYKGNVIIALTDGQGKKVQCYTAYGAYPKSITHGELSYTNSEVKLLTVTYSYDYAKVEFKAGADDTNRTRTRTPAQLAAFRSQ